MEHLQTYTSEILTTLDNGFLSVQQQVLSRYPSLSTYNDFQKFLLLNALLILFCICFKIIYFLRPSNIMRIVNRFIYQLPFVKKKIDNELQKLKKQITTQFPEQCRSKLKSIPYKPQPLLDDKSQGQSLQGYLSGSRYPQKSHSDFVISLSKQFAYSNPLHYDLHPQIKQMQVQVIKMCAKFLKFQSKDGEAIGGTFSGGTESIIMSILAYRQYGYNIKGIKNPNFLICASGHAAAFKACNYFQIEPRTVKFDKDFKMDISDMKRKMDSNTIGVYTSCPNYPYGTIDPIDNIASYCRKRQIPIHIDMCLGGFLVPFLKKEDDKPLFQVPQGITSISIDAHKYGLSAKGISVLLFSDEKYRCQKLFTITQWPGGLYATQGMAGSRPGSAIASAWISMMKLGGKGYTQNAKAIRQATIRTAKVLKDLGYKVFGEPEVCGVGFCHSQFPVSSIQQEMKKRHWHLSLIQKPMGLHFSFTPLNSKRVNEMIKDFKQSTKVLTELKAQGKLPKDTAQLELYGACAKIGDGPTKKLIINTLLDAFMDI